MPDKPEEAKEIETEDKLGARVQELNPQLAARYRITGVKKGILVVGVEDGSLADRSVSRKEMSFSKSIARRSKP
jgi:S1-C subfamily serine protease